MTLAPVVVCATLEDGLNGTLKVKGSRRSTLADGSVGWVDGMLGCNLVAMVASRDSGTSDVHELLLRVEWELGNTFIDLLSQTKFERET